MNNHRDYAAAAAYRQFEESLANNNNVFDSSSSGGGGVYQQQQQQQQQQFSYGNNDPCSLMYNPGSTSCSTGNAYHDSTTGNTVTNINNQSQQQQFQQPHHSLLVSVAQYGGGGGGGGAPGASAASNTTAANNTQHSQQYLVNVQPQQHQHQQLQHHQHQHQHQHQHHQQQMNNNCTTTNYNNSCITTAVAAASAAASYSPALNATGTPLKRISSLDEFLLCNPGLLSGNALDPTPVVTTSSTAEQMYNNSCPGSALTSSGSHHHNHHQQQQQQHQDEQQWLQEMRIKASGLSLEPMSGTDVMKRLRKKMDDVVTCYLPCVEFLVQCQQELRRGLHHAQHHSSSSHHRGHGRRRSHNNHGMSPRQFYSTYVHPLPQTFQLKNQFVMSSEQFSKALNALYKLSQDAKKSERHGSESVKNQFLGGMKEGQSWGLRKWLSQHGSALHICTDIECIVTACRELDKGDINTKRLADLIRPLAQQTMDRLKKQVPQSYQEHSSAHPYLPFFHRLESALRNMASFDPDDDGVVVIDDSDDDEPEPVVSKPRAAVVLPPPKKKKPTRKRQRSSTKREITAIDTLDDDDDNNNTAKKPALEKNPPAPAAATATATVDLTATNNNNNNNSPPAIPNPLMNDDDGSSSGESDEEDIIEIIAVNKPRPDSTNNSPIPFAAAAADNGGSAEWKCPSCSRMNTPSSGDTCEHCGEQNFLKDLNSELDWFEELVNGSNHGSLSGLGGSGGGNSSCNSSIVGGVLPPLPPEAPAETETAVATTTATTTEAIVQWPVPLLNEDATYTCATTMANHLDRLAHLFEQGRQGAVRPPSAPSGSFWDGDRYAAALRIFSSVLRNRQSPHFVYRINDDHLIDNGQLPFSHVIKHPISFSDIVTSLINVDGEISDYDGATTFDDDLPECLDGRLPVQGLGSWNMWKGMDLVQAVDLVLLNSLAYGKQVEQKKKSQHRSLINKLRKILWDGVHNIVAEAIDPCDLNRKKACTPTRRSETSGFVVYKIK